MDHKGTGNAGDITSTLVRWQRRIPAGRVDSRLMARSLGSVYIAGATLALIWDALPSPVPSNTVAIAIIAGFAEVVGLVLVSGRMDTRPRLVFEAAVALATVLISLLDYYARVRGTGLTYLYLWCTPFAYWFFPRRRALAQAALVIVGFAAASIAASRLHPGLAGSVREDWGPILMLAGTVLVVGELVRRLGLTIDESHRRFAWAFAQAPAPMARINLEGYYTDANHAFCVAAGREREDVIGATVAELAPREQLSSLFEVRDALVSGRRRASQFDADLVRPDGVRVTLAISVSLLGSPGDPKAELFVQALDLSHRQRAEQALAASEQRYRTLVETSQAVVWACDPDGRVTFVNDAIRTVLGYTPEEALGHRLAGALPEGERSHLMASVAALRETGSDSGERVYRRKDGSVAIGSYNVTVLRDELGEITGYTGTLLDVTERRRAEEGLRVSEARLRAVIENAPAAITIRDAAGRLSVVNREAARLLGDEPERLIGRSYQELHSHHEAQELLLSDRRVLDAAEPVFFEQTLTLRDGEHIFLAVAFPLPAAEGEPRNICRIAFDVTDRERARQELVRSNEQRRRLLAELVRAQEAERRRIAADVHDDSIQVLAGVAIRLGMLAGMLDRPEQQRLIAGLDDSVRRGIRSLRQLLFDLRLPALDELGLAAALRSYLSETVAREGVTYTLDDGLDSEPPGELRTVLYRVAQEALSNIRKHAHARHVEVVLRGSPDGYTVVVRDDGVGFDAAEYPEGVPGHLGLVGMRERIEAAGGRIDVRSERGRGTTVEFGVPTGRPVVASMAAQREV